MRWMALALMVPWVVAGCSEYNINGEQKPPTEAEEEEEEPEDLPQPDIEVEPLFVDFGFLAKDCASDIETVRITNVGNAKLDVSKISLDGADEDLFRKVGGPAVLKKGEWIEVSVDFTPDGWNQYSSNLIIESDDPDEPEVVVDLMGTGAEDAIVEESFQQELANEIDVVWIIDNSGSMSNEVNALAGVFDVFINNFVNLGLDYQIGVITTDMDDPNQSGKIQGPIIHSGMSASAAVAEFNLQAAQGSSGSGSERASDAAYAALTAPVINNENLGLVRQDSNLTIIAVSDEDDDSDIDVNTFNNWLENYQSGDPNKASFSGIVGPERQGLFQLPCITFATGADAEPVSRYPKLIQGTGGVHADICALDFTDVLQMLAMQAAGLKDRWELDYVPNDQPEVEVDGQTVPADPNNGWTYDPATNEIIFNGDSVPDPGDDVNITYPIVTECIP